MLISPEARVAFPRHQFPPDVDQVPGRLGEGAARICLLPPVEIAPAPLFTLLCDAVSLGDRGHGFTAMTVSRYFHSQDFSPRRQKSVSTDWYGHPTARRSFSESLNTTHLTGVTIILLLSTRLVYRGLFGQRPWRKSRYHHRCDRFESVERNLWPGRVSRPAICLLFYQQFVQKCVGRPIF